MGMGSANISDPSSDPNKGEQTKKLHKPKKQIKTSHQ
jgi:hypothetical protein